MRLFIHFTAVTLFCILFSCSKSEGTDSNMTDNEETIDLDSSPVISSINIDASNKFAGDQINVTAEVSDINNDIVSYEWSVSNGTFETETNQSIIWKTDDNVENHIVRLVVTDSKNNATTKSENIRLDFAPQTFQKIVEAEYYRLFSENKILALGEYIFYYSAEATFSNGVTYRLKKFDFKGNEIWTKTYEDFPTDPRNVNTLLKTPDENMIIDIDGAIVKVNQEGEVIWTYGNQYLKRFSVMENGDYFFIGSINGNASYHILTPDGVLVREGTIQADYEIFGFTDVLKATSQDTFYALAYVSIPDSPSSPGAIVHIDSSGDILDTFEIAYNPRTNGRFFLNEKKTITGFFTTKRDGNATINKIEITDSGELINETEYTFNSYTELLNVEQTTTGEFLIGGTFGLISRQTKSFIAKINMNGGIEWNIENGNNSDLMDFCSAVLELPNGKIIASGSTLSGTNVKGFLNKYDPEGNSQ